MSLSLIFDKADLCRSKMGSITAPIYFAHGDFYFPGKQWSDFVVVVMGWWLQSISKIIKGWETVVEFDFMDGPMLIRVSKISDSELKLECVNQRNTAEVMECSYTMPLSDLLAELLKVAKDIIE